MMTRLRMLMIEKVGCRYKKEILGYLWVFWGVVFFYVGLQSVCPHYFLGDDNANYFLPLYDLVAASPWEGTGLAWWNPYQDLGQEVHSRAQLAVLYPPVYLAFGLSHLLFAKATAGIDILAGMHLVWAAWGMYTLALHFRAERKWAVIWGLMWATQPFVVQLTRCWISTLYTASWMPWILFALLWMAGRPSVPRALVLAGLRAILVFSGHPHSFLIFSAMEGVFAVVSLAGMPGPVKKPFVVTYVFSWVITGLWAAPQLLPFVEAMEVSSRRGQPMPLASMLAWSMYVQDWWNAQWGAWRGESYIMWNNGVFWQGGPWLIVVLCGVIGWVRQNKPVQPFLALLVSSLCAFTLCTVLYVLVAWIPMFDRLRWPGRNFVVFAFLFMALGILIISQLPRMGRMWRLFTLGAVLLSLVVNGAYSLFFSRAHPSGDRVPEVASMKSMSERIPDASFRAATVWPVEGLDASWRYAAYNFGTLLRSPHFSGYDILRTKEHNAFLNTFHHHGAFDQFPGEAQLEHLRLWGTRYYYVSKEALPKLGEFGILGEDAGLRLVEDTAAQAPARLAGKPVPLVWKINGGRVELADHGEGGWLEWAVWPVKGMTLWADGRLLESGMHFDGTNPPRVWVPAGTRTVELRVGCPGFRAGMAMAGVGLVLAVGAWVFFPGHSGKGFLSGRQGPGHETVR
ncbi:MAG: hypothetical protein SFU85_07735 [Candidatus Methylacidiphilales bacterium]|nr:hypothetical protein [Candidatus Methylacidiphilales bacterium]